MRQCIPDFAVVAGTRPVAAPIPENEIKKDNDDDDDDDEEEEDDDERTRAPPRAARPRSHFRRRGAAAGDREVSLASVTPRSWHRTRH